MTSRELDEKIKQLEETLRDCTLCPRECQYHPCFKAFGSPPLDRRLTEEEYSDAVRSAVRAGLKRIDGVTV